MTTSLYQQDFAAWAAEQAQLLKKGRLHELDIVNLAEEIESMGKSEHRELRSRLILLIAHLLKWQYQSSHRTPSWRLTILEQRDAIAALLDDSPSLRRYLEETAWLEKIWQSAVKLAAAETGLGKASFPFAPCWTAPQLLEDEFYPDAAEG